MRKVIRSDRFKAIVEAYGVNPKRWPESERAAALDFLERNPQKAETLMRDARETDGFLSVLNAPQASDALHWETLARLMPATVAEVLAFVPRRARPSAGLMLAGSIGLAAACAAGVVVGINVGLMGTADMRAQEVLASVSVIEVDNW